jgi:hypothetical protein
VSIRDDDNRCCAQILLYSSYTRISSDLNNRENMIFKNYCSIFFLFSLLTKHACMNMHMGAHRRHGLKLSSTMWTCSSHMFFIIRIMSNHMISQVIFRAKSLIRTHVTEPFFWAAVHLFFVFSNIILKLNSKIITLKKKN